MAIKTRLVKTSVKLVLIFLKDSECLVRLVSGTINNIRAKIIRDEILLTIPVTLGTRPSESELQNSYRKSIYDFIGLSVNDLPEGNGVIIIEIDPKSEAYKNNLRKNDVITEIGKVPILSKIDYDREINNYKSGEPIMLRLVKDEMTRYVAFLIK